jgi:Putative zinc dependent peptidase (DUF5700)
MALLLAPALALSLASPPASPLDVRIDLAEAEAVLAILDARATGRAPAPRAWQELAASPGYARLKKREASLDRAFTDDDFRAFVLSDALLARRDALRAEVQAWRRADLRGAAERALRYLPAGTRLRATIYPVIKPRPNSFVFELESDPAVFFALGTPEVSPGRIENTAAHELHHVGTEAHARAAEMRLARLPEPRRTAALYTSAFGEGIAVLAAAGGPSVHPHATDTPEGRARWDHDLARAADDLAAVQRFLLDVAEGRVAGDAARRALFAFMSDDERPQGAWYTLGWRMAALVEQDLGRDAVVACITDPPLLLVRYQEVARRRNAAGEKLPLWSDALLAAIRTR